MQESTSGTMRMMLRGSWYCSSLAMANLFTQEGFWTMPTSRIRALACDFHACLTTRSEHADEPRKGHSWLCQQLATRYSSNLLDTVCK